MRQASKRRALFCSPDVDASSPGFASVTRPRHRFSMSEQLLEIKASRPTGEEEGRPRPLSLSAGTDGVTSLANQRLRAPVRPSHPRRFRRARKAQLQRSLRSLRQSAAGEATAAAAAAAPSPGLLHSQ